MARRKPDAQAPDTQAGVRETAYYLWEREGRPDGQDREHWERANAEKASGARRQEEHIEDEEKILDGRLDVNFPALLTKDVPGG